MTDFTKILDKAKELEAKMKESQEKIKEIKAEGVSGSNSVKITLDGEGEMSVKEKQKNKKDELISEVKNSEIYKKIMEKFPDAELIDVKLNKKKEDKND